MELNDNKELIIENEILPDLGIMLSYGTGEDLVSMGVFFVEGYYDLTGEKLDELPPDKKGIEVELVEYELTEDLKVKKKENGLKIRMPYNKAKELYNSSAEANYKKAFDNSERKYDGRKLIAKLDKELSRLYAEYPLFVQDGFTGLESRTLESLEGSLFASDGSDMGVDFRIFPFLYSKIKERYLEKTINNKDKFDKDLLYNYIYLLNYDNNIKEEKYKLEDGSIYEPGPGSLEMPEREYERGEDEEHHLHR